MFKIHNRKIVECSLQIAIGHICYQVKDNGKPIWEAKLDIDSCAQAFNYFGGIASAIVGLYYFLPILLNSVLNKSKLLYLNIYLYYNYILICLLVVLKQDH